MSEKKYLKLASRVAKVAPSPTMAISAKAKQMKEDGLDVLVFAAGEPDFDTPEFIKEGARDALAKGLTKYTANLGTLALRKEIAKKFKEDNHLDYDVKNIIVSSGAKQSVANAIFVTIGEGDEVIIPAPYWVSYPEMVNLADGTNAIVQTEPENNFCPTAKALREAITPRSKMLILNTPGNPSGGAYERSQLEEILEVVLEHDLLVLSDEIYEKVLYDGRKHTAFASLSKEAFERTITVNGVSKSFSMTGWRIGYAAGPAPIVNAMDSFQSHFTSNASSISQHATLEALRGDQSFLAEWIAEFDKRRKLIVGGLNSIEGINIAMPGGAFYAFFSMKGLIGKKVAGKTIAGSLDFCANALEDAKVALVPGVAFGSEGYVRMSYACSEDEIREGIRRLKAWIEGT
ncbi:MAG: pyridoxal phosphate-dependent aminotransferase [Planctomycetes bacterium]|nr:pyridoxal phosphate-dependent aminotransferase [Planctomycetota bacterium]